MVRSEVAEQPGETMSARLSCEGECPQEDESNVRLIVSTLLRTKCLSLSLEASQNNAISESIQR